jgi:hypothetical protein
LDQTFREIGRRSVEDAVRYGCFRMEDQAFHPVWNDGLAVLSLCPEAGTLFAQDTNAPMESLKQVLAKCGAIHAKGLATRDAERKRQTRDSLKALERTRRDSLARVALAKKRYATGKKAILATLTSCIEQLDTTRKSVLAIKEVVPLDASLYRITWTESLDERETPFRKKVTLENGVCFFEDEDFEESAQPQDPNEP